MSRKILVILFLALSSAALAQPNRAYVDSLLTELKQAGEDTNKAILLYRLAWEYRVLNADSGIRFGEQGLELSQRLKFQKGIGASCNNLGGVYEAIGNEWIALKYYLEALDAKKQTGDKRSIASTLNNIGIIYRKQEDYKEALSYYLQALAINRESGNVRFIIANNYNIGNVYKDMGRLDSSMVYYRNTYRLCLEQNNYKTLADVLASIGNNYFSRKDYGNAAHYYDTSRVIVEQHGLQAGTDFFYFSNKGRLFLALQNLDSARYYLDKAWSLKKDGKEWVQAASNCANDLSDLYLALYRRSQRPQDLETSREFLRIYSAARDSIGNYKRSRDISKLITEDLLRQKDNEIRSIQREKDIAGLQASNEQLYRNLWTVVSLAVAVLALFIWLRFRKNKQLNRELAEKNALIENKNKEILDSITYAQRLQRAILSTPGEIAAHLPDSFVLYLPKDIVAGDFYFFEATEEHIFIAAADCTGHGVPGAMVSVVCSNALSAAVSEFRLSDPGQLLDRVKKIVTETFDRSGNDVKDGMDISLLVIGRKTGEINWSGANNPLWYICEGETEMRQLRPNKQPVGRSDQGEPFTTHRIVPGRPAFFYLFTDGFADQFGGPEGKKLKSAQLKKLLLQHHAAAPEQQKVLLEKAFEDWKGACEQVDDVCLIGLRLAPVS